MSTPDTSPANTGVICWMLSVIAASSCCSGRLCDRRLCTANRGAPHVAHLGVIETTNTMHDLPVVPHHEIMLPPLVRVDELRLRRVLHQVADEGTRLRHRPADDGAD